MYDRGFRSKVWTSVSTHIQLLLNKYNNAHMDENDYEGDYVNQMELVAKARPYLIVFLYHENI
jgi:hypothetical protein